MLKAGLLALCGALLLALPAKAQGQRTDGNKLLEDCEAVDRPIKDLSGDEKMNSMACLGYLIGISEAESVHKQMGDTTYFCMPPQVTSGQLALVVVKGLKEQPENLHQGRSGLVFLIFHKAFPCK